MIVDAVRRIGRLKGLTQGLEWMFEGQRNLHEKFALFLFSKRYPSSCSEPEFHQYYSTRLFHHLVVSLNCSWDHVLVIRKQNLKFCQVYLSAQVFHYSCFENQTYNLHKVLICICHCIALSPSSEYKRENKNSVKQFSTSFGDNW